jgi:xanthine dehydrogenase accessory factor
MILLRKIGGLAMFDLEALSVAVARHGRVARVVIVQHAGSSPREDGASMLVWTDGQSGTIGGGALEWEAAARARLALQTGDRVDKVPLGPELGQCCGGALMLLTEVWTESRLATVTGDAFVRPYLCDRAEMPLKVANRLRRARSGSHVLVTEQVQGWFIEPIARPTRLVWVWGAGHVGRAIVQVLAPLPGVAITWIDTAENRFPEGVIEGVERVVAENLGALAETAPPTAEHLILTYSHALDLELCHRLLLRGFRSCGLIGSATKWARFRSRLAALGHSAEAVSRIRCPIGDPSLGKHPQAIAVGVVADLLRAPAAAAREKRA